MWRTISLLAIAVPWLACRTRGAPDAGSRLAAPEIDAGVALPSLTLTVRAMMPDGGSVMMAMEPTMADRTVIDAAVAFEIAANVVLRNYRLRLFDEADRALISDDEARDLPRGTVYRILLPSSLKRGHRYSLLLDAASGAELADVLDRAHGDRRLELLVSGDKEKPAPAKKAKKKHKKRRR